MAAQELALVQPFHEIGFELDGCSAFERMTASGYYWLVTREDGPEPPTSADDIVSVGYYDDQGDCRAIFSTVARLLLDGSIRLEFYRE